MVVKEANAITAGEGVGSKLPHDRWTGSWLVEDMETTRSTLRRVTMARRTIRKRVVSAVSLKPFHPSPPHL